MQFRSFRFDTASLHTLFAPRKPRAPLLRLALGLVGLALLAVLVFVSVFVGAAMVAGGLAWKLLRNRGANAPARAGARVVDAEYRVLRKPALPASR
ncbi:MAG TPA: hypothetical protein VFF91_00980 [Pseudoxanthomonas sp.]|nr:hypothetical protein [Pseudoxanthomonas sp.]